MLMTDFIFDAEMQLTKGNLKAHLDLYSFLEKNVYIIYCPALDLSGYGETEEDARKSFEEVFTSTMKYMVNKNTLHEDLRKHGWNVRGKKSHDLKSPKFEDMYRSNKDFKEIIDKKPYQRTYKDVMIPA
jgi:hypothetical protein